MWGGWGAGAVVGEGGLVGRESWGLADKFAYYTLIIEF